MNGWPLFVVRLSSASSQRFNNPIGRLLVVRFAVYADIALAGICKRSRFCSESNDDEK